MRVLTLRDDDANGTTPVELLGRLHGDALGRGMPIALAIIPEARLDTHTAEGRCERYRRGTRAGAPGVASVTDHPALVRFARRLEVLQHGLQHDRVDDAYELARVEAGSDIRVVTHREAAPRVRQTKTR